MRKLHKEYENQLLARILANEKEYFANASDITENIFFELNNKKIFETYFDIIKENKQPNMARLASALPDLENYMLKLAMNVNFDIEISDIIPELVNRHEVFVLKQTLAECRNLFDSEEILKKLCGAIGKAHISGRDEIMTGFEVARNIIKSLNDPTMQGLPTGFEKYDKLAGLVKSDLIILAGETSHGKTALTLNIASNLITNGIPVCFISFEMSNTQLMQRMLMLRSGVRKFEIKEKYELYEKTASSFYKLPFFLANLNNNNIHNVTATIREMKIKHDIRVAMIDYLQLVSDSSRRSREEEVGQNARILKNLAKELDITVIALSQLSRSDRRTEPTLSRLRDSGQVEEAADIVWFIYRPEEHQIAEYEGLNTNELGVNIIAKGRNYGTGKFFTTFKKDTTQFLDGYDTPGIGVPAGFERYTDEKSF